MGWQDRRARRASIARGIARQSQQNCHGTKRQNKLGLVIVTNPNGKWQDRYLDIYYRRKPGYIKPADAWLKSLISCVPPRAAILEIGGGPAKSPSRELRSVASRLVGLDVDPVVRSNPFLDEAVVYDGEEFPFDASSFDVVVSNWVNEHLTDPETHFREAFRVLKVGGLYIFRTPNRWHYKSLVAMLVPSRLQVPLVRWLRQIPDEQHDPYPLFLRANSVRRVRGLLRSSGFSLRSLQMIEPYPYYGMRSRILFVVFMAYERTVNSSQRLAGLRHTMECVAEKPSDISHEIRPTLCANTSELKSYQLVVPAAKDQPAGR
jgi:SAM-dependent methyltransferase